MISVSRVLPQVHVLDGLGRGAKDRAGGSGRDGAAGAGQHVSRLAQRTGAGLQREEDLLGRRQDRRHRGAESITIIHTRNNI